jgi:hypothetical protein
MDLFHEDKNRAKDCVFGTHRSDTVVVFEVNSIGVSTFIVFAGVKPRLL